MEFFLGINEPYWLAHCDFPLMVARQRLFRPGKQRRPLPVARHRWVLDSGGFTQLHQHGRYPFTADQYASEIETLDDEVGNLAWASPMDWMCEEGALSQTGLTVGEHQRRTVTNFLDLRQRLGRLVIPVLQGWEHDDYLRCSDLYQAAGVDLSQEPTTYSSAPTPWRGPTGPDEAGVTRTASTAAVTIAGSLRPSGGRTF
mgnify:CR=1 FL=1